MRRVLVASILSLAVLAGAQTDVRALLKGDEVRWTNVLQGDPARYASAVVSALKDGDPVVRRNAAAALGGMDLAEEAAMRDRRLVGTDEDDETADARRATVVAALAVAGRDPDPGVREAAIEALVIVLRNREWGRHGEVRGDPAELRPLTDLGAEIAPVLARALRSTEVEYAVKVSAVRALKKVGGSGALDALLFVVDQERGALMGEAMRAAARYDDPRVVSTIVRNVTKSIPDHSGTPGAWVLRRMGARAVPGMLRALAASPDDSVRFYLLQTFGMVVDSRAWPFLLEALEDPKDSVAAQAASSLAAYPGAATVAGLVRAAYHASPGVREAALFSLGDLQTKEAREVVRRALKDREAAVRGAAATSLAAIDGRAAVPSLLPLFADEAVRFPLVYALRPLRDLRTAPGLIAAFRAGGGIADEAGMALAEMGAVEAIPVLIEALRGGKAGSASRALFAFGKAAADPLLAFYPNAGNARGAVVQALGGSHDPRAVDLLIPLVDDPSLSSTAIEALGHLGDARAIRPILGQLDSKDEDRAEVAAEALGELRAREAVPALLRALAREDATGRAAGALAQIGDARALDPLLRWLTEDRERDGRGRALENLGTFRDPRVFRLLIDEIEAESWGASSAARALGKLGDLRALPPLRRALESDDDALVREAQAAIGRLTDKKAGS